MQNQAVRKIAVTFKTRPIIAMETELAIPPVGVRLDNLWWKYASRWISMPYNHPIREELPTSLQRTKDNEKIDRQKDTSWNRNGNKY